MSKNIFKNIFLLVHPFALYLWSFSSLRPFGGGSNLVVRPPYIIQPWRWWNKRIVSLFFFMKSIMEIVIISWFYLTSDLQSSMLVGWGDWGGETLKTIYFHRLRSAVCLHCHHLALLHDQLFTFCFPYFKTILKVFKSFAKGLICWLKYLKLLFHKWCKLSKLF